MPTMLIDEETLRPVLRAPLCIVATRGGGSRQRSLLRHPDQMRGAVGALGYRKASVRAVQPPLDLFEEE